MKRLLSVILFLSVLLTVQAQQQIKIISARLYGAIPNDGHNDQKILRYLIRKVQAMPNTYILLEPGKYDAKKLRIDYEIIAETGHTTEYYVPKGFKKMFFIFLVPDKKTINNTDIALSVN